MVIDVHVHPTGYSLISQDPEERKFRDKVFQRKYDESKLPIAMTGKPSGGNSGGGNSEEVTFTQMDSFGIDRLVFTGVAGGLDVRARIGDIVVAERLYHHDVDASPFKPRYFVPLVGPDGIAADAETSQALAEAAQRFAGRIDRYIAQEDIQAFSLQSVSVHRKNIATGDQFVKTAEVKDRITTDLPDMFCVEMEGAAVAQVCWEHGVPFAVMRTISDTADGDSPSDYPKFLNRVASTYSFYIVKEFFAALS